MIICTPLKTKRLALTPRELTHGESVAILKIPGERFELGTTAILKCIADSAHAPAPGYVTDPRLWTIEERAFVMATYLSYVSPDGPDFAIGENSLSDYVSFTSDLKTAEFELGVVAGVETLLRPLLGIHAEILERECQSRGDWIRGAMACQMFKKGEPEPDWLTLSEVEILEWVKSRIEAMKKMPESDFDECVFAFLKGQPGLFHFFCPEFSDEGIVWARLEHGGAGDSPARFPPLSCIGETTKRLFGHAG